MDEDALLDAARDRIIAVGLRRATLTDVARRAGVSRMSIYRRWPDMSALVGDVMTREWVGVLTASGVRPGADARGRMVAEIVAGAGALRAHPMFRRILELDPEILLPYLVDRRGASQDAMLARITFLIEEGQGDGSVRTGVPAVLAATVLLAVQPFVLSASIMAIPLDALDAELTLLLDRYLAR